MKCKGVIFSGHAVIQMFKRGIQVEDIQKVLETGILIKEYPEDKPNPSILMLGFIDNRPLHVVASTNTTGNCIIITAYEPDAKIWNEKFTIKNKSDGMRNL